MSTPEGLASADKLADESKAPGALAEETVAEVERALNRHSPELADRLRALSLRIAETPELSHIDVRGIADECLALFQEFLDLSVLWNGIAEPRPDKALTRERLSLILSTRDLPKKEPE